MEQLTRTDEQYSQLVDNRLDQQIADARAGRRSSLSAKAAARYLGIHVETLGSWRRQIPPMGPPFKKGADGQGTANQSVYYDFQELDAWDKSRQGRTPKERKLQDAISREEQELRLLQLEAKLEVLRKEKAKLKRQLKHTNFATLAACVDEQDWVWDGSAIAGHVLQVDEPLLISAIDDDRVVSADLASALALPWADPNAREPFELALIQVLDDTRAKLADAQRAGDALRAQRAREALAQITPSATGQPRGPLRP